jgi:hypothetical protein
LKLAKFIYAKKYDDKFKEIGIKQFINACIFNGLVNRECLKSFLESSTVPFNRYSEEDDDYDSWDDDYDFWDESSNFSSDFETDFNNMPRNPIHLESNNNLVDAATTNANSAERLIASLDINGKFPLSLKSLARIKVKNCMISYSKKSIEALYFLPQDLHAFLMFQDEIDEIKRLALDNATTQNNLD